MSIDRLTARKIVRALQSYTIEAKKWLSDSHHRRVLRWNRIRGDQTLRLEYELSNESVVFDLGGYRGEWSQQILDRYNCSIHIFEPIEEFATQISTRFSGDERVEIHPFALGVRTEDAEISLRHEDSSLFRQEAGLGDSASQKIRVVSIDDFLQEKSVGFIDLMKVNIEGAEYELMDHLLEHEIVERIGNIQIQFHEFVPNARPRMKAIQKQLSRTHVPTFKIPFVWENWRLITRHPGGH